MGPNYRWIILSVSIITLILGYAIRNTFSVFYPAIVEDFGWGRGNTALMFSINMFLYGMASPFAGRLIDRFEPRIVIPVGACITGVGIALCSLSHSEWHFYLFYGLFTGIGLCIIGWTPFTAIVANWFVENRGQAFGILAAGFGGSLAVTPLAQFLITTYGWRTAYVVMGAVTVCIIVPLCGMFLFHNPAHRSLGKPLKLSDVSRPETSAGVNPENVESDTVWTYGKALRSYRFWLLFLIAFCLLGLAEQILIAHQVYFLRDAGFSPAAAANIYSVFGFTFILGNLCGFLSDRFGRVQVFTVCCTLCTAGVLLLFFIDDVSKVRMAILFAVLTGVGIGASAPALFASVADLFQGPYFGTIQGTVVLGFAMGGTIAPWFAGFLFDRTESYTSTFVIVLVSFIISALAMILVAPGKTSRKYAAG